ncbi:MAG TPA: hypothetical protein VFB62_04915 [Polyangiaceae bacterium]|nr:hypothetical protein [Polyangiaceae bacterium]
MSRRSYPPIHFEPSALRDHGDAARVDRVWERLERNIALGPATKKPLRSRRFVWALAAAVFSGFVVGYVVNGAITDAPTAEPRVIPEENDPGAPQTVFAAAEEPRVYPLPGGGFIKVERHSIVDVVNQGLDGLTLRLVRGEATVSTMSDTRRTSRLALQVGRAELVTASGSMRVRLDGDTADLEVLYGTASLNAPDEDIQQRELSPGRQRVRVAVITTERKRTAQRPAVLETEPEPIDGVSPAVPEPVILPEPASHTTPWIKACADFDYAEAAKLIQKEPGGADAALAGVTNPTLLACIGTGHEDTGNNKAAIAMYERMLHDDSSNTANREAAASYLARLYKQMGNKAMADHYDRYRGALQSADGLCKNIQAAQAKNAQEAARLSKKYRRLYPDGECIDLIDKLEADLRAKGKGQPPSTVEPSRDDEDEADEIAPK